MLVALSLIITYLRKWHQFWFVAFNIKTHTELVLIHHYTSISSIGIWFNMELICEKCDQWTNKSALTYSAVQSQISDSLYAMWKGICSNCSCNVLIAHTIGPHYSLVPSRWYMTAILTSRSVAWRTFSSEKNCCKSMKRWRVFKICSE